MTAKEKALEAYPMLRVYNEAYQEVIDANEIKREAFAEGYEQALKDIWHKATEDDLPEHYTRICLYRDGSLLSGEYRPHTKPLGELYDGDCNFFQYGDRWCYLEDIKPNP